MIKNNLLKLMEERGISLTELARLSGIRINVLYDLYHSKAEGISRAMLNKLCYVFDCNVRDILEYIPD